MLSPRGQAGLEANFLSSSWASKTCPRPRPRAFGLGLSSNFLLWHCENAWNDYSGIGYHYVFTM